MPSFIKKNFSQKRKQHNIFVYFPLLLKETSNNFQFVTPAHSAFTADYELPGKKSQLFVIALADKAEGKDMIQKYIQQTEKTEKRVAEGRHLISDPHHGEVDLYWKGGNIWGILNLNGPEFRSKYLKLFEEGLQKRK